jgi:hypothetical protein
MNHSHRLRSWPNGFVSGGKAIMVLSVPEIVRNKEYWIDGLVRPAFVQAWQQEVPEMRQSRQTGVNGVLVVDAILHAVWICADA